MTWFLEIRMGRPFSVFDGDGRLLSENCPTLRVPFSERRRADEAMHELAIELVRDPAGTVVQGSVVKEGDDGEEAPGEGEQQERSA